MNIYTKNEVLKMFVRYKLYTHGYTFGDIANYFGCTRNTVTLLVQGKLPGHRLQKRLDGQGKPQVHQYMASKMGYKNWAEVEAEAAVAYKEGKDKK